MDLPALFRCERQSMTLTPLGCKKLWLAAQARRPEPWESRHKCLSCPIGAGHAGVSPEEQAAKAAADSLRTVCARCQRLAERGDRRQPLVNGNHCVSCDNRQREAMRGRNAKGNPPQLMSKLHAQTLIAGGVALTFPKVLDRVEAIILASKQIASSGAISIGRPPLPSWQTPEPVEQDEPHA